MTIWGIVLQNTGIKFPLGECYLFENRKPKAVTFCQVAAQLSPALSFHCCCCHYGPFQEQMEKLSSSKVPRRNPAKISQEFPFNPLLVN